MCKFSHLTMEDSNIWNTYTNLSGSDKFAYALMQSMRQETFPGFLDRTVV